MKWLRYKPKVSFVFFSGSKTYMMILWERVQTGEEEKRVSVGLFFLHEAGGVVVGAQQMIWNDSH